MEESGSEGLDELIQKEAKNYFKDVDCVCISDNYWLNERTVSKIIILLIWRRSFTPITTIVTQALPNLWAGELYSLIYAYTCFHNPDYVPARHYVLQSFHLWTKARLAFRSVRWDGARGKFRHCFLLCKSRGLTRLRAHLQPMTDLSILLSKLVTPKGDILIPGLSELIAPLTPEEKDRYNALDYSISV